MSLESLITAAAVLVTFAPYMGTVATKAIPTHRARRRPDLGGKP